MKSTDVVCIGLSCVDISIVGVDGGKFFHQPLNSADTLKFSVGGDATNEALTLARLGHKVKLMTRVGHDFLGHFIEWTVKSQGIDKSTIRIDDSVETTTAILVIGKNDDRHYKDRSVSTFCGADIDYEALKDAKVVSLGSLMMLPSLKAEDIAKAFRTAKEAGAIVCADIALGRRTPIDSILPVLPYVDYFFPNLEEGQLLTGLETKEEISEYLLKCGVKNVVLKLGGQGCYIRNSDTEMIVPPYYVEPVDTTGAGDNFAAGFISGLVRDLPLLECAKFASACASIAVQHVGASTGVKSMEQVQAVINNG